MSIDLKLGSYFWVLLSILLILLLAFFFLIFDMPSQTKKQALLRIPVLSTKPMQTTLMNEKLKTVWSKSFSKELDNSDAAYYG